ncbi:MAG: KpsF/GutQ family sugar-phosphate isomerase [Planctomycetes bacterium]|jgi:arabinose-5-phosphate isomerase|nr:KpsF/GutQ family sugar-phosphate isomerase [Planctomycetota bacterium]
MGELSDFGRDVVRQEAEGLRLLLELVDGAFEAAVKAVIDCRGHVVVTGVGKPWLVGQKISATLASTGTPSFALHPSEAVHGDLGRLRAHDLVIALSNSGESEEVTRLLPVLKRLGCRVIGVTGNPQSSLGQHSDLVLRLPRAPEACPIGMAPSVSTTAMLALGDALALAVMKARNFTREDYARFHPGGALGRSLMKVTDIMRPLEETAVVGVSAVVADALHAITLHKTGAAFVVELGRLRGVFTDGDLRRHVRDEALLDTPIVEVMTSPCRSIGADRLAPEAVRTMVEGRRIGELPVVDSQDRILGHIALKDLVAMNFM